MRESLKETKVMPLRLEASDYKKLRNIAFKNDTSIAALIRRGIELVLKDIERKGK